MSKYKLISSTVLIKLNVKHHLDASCVCFLRTEMYMQTFSSTNAISKWHCHRCLSLVTRKATKEDNSITPHPGNAFPIALFLKKISDSLSCLHHCSTKRRCCDLKKHCTEHSQGAVAYSDTFYCWTWNTRREKKSQSQETSSWEGIWLCFINSRGCRNCVSIKKGNILEDLGGLKTQIQETALVLQQENVLAS